MQEPIDLDMDSCLTEMERIQAKIIELKEQQREELENKKKVQTIEPNMMVIQEWLDNFCHNKKQKALAEQAKKKKDIYFEKCQNHNRQQERKQHYQTREDLYQRKMSQVRNRTRRNNNKDTIQDEERKTIMENYRTYCNDNYENDGLITKPANLKPLGTFNSERMGYNINYCHDYIHLNNPSDFMNNYIEATYNIFKIQQTKIESLESAVASLNAKIDGQSFTKTI